MATTHKFPSPRTNLGDDENVVDTDAQEEEGDDGVGGGVEQAQSRANPVRKYHAWIIVKICVQFKICILFNISKYCLKYHHVKYLDIIMSE